MSLIVNERVKLLMLDHKIFATSALENHVVARARHRVLVEKDHDVVDLIPYFVAESWDFFAINTRGI